MYFLHHDKTGTVKALLAAGADVNHQEKVNNPTSLCREYLHYNLNEHCISMQLIVEADG